MRVTADQTAVLTVDGASQTVRVGDDFGPDGSLLLLSLQQGPDDGQWTAVVQRGSGDPFDVVTGLARARLTAGPPARHLRSALRPVDARPAAPCCLSRPIRPTGRPEEPP